MILNFQIFVMLMRMVQWQISLPLFEIQILVDFMKTIICTLHWQFILMSLYYCNVGWGISYLSKWNSICLHLNNHFKGFFQQCIVPLRYSMTVHTWRNSIKTHRKIRGLQFLDMLKLFERLLLFYQPIIFAQVSFREI